MEKMILPDDFDGIFRFTNWTKEEFTAYWNKKAYTFPALKTSPIIIEDATPLEIQSIRKKFAKELAEREFFKSSQAKKLSSIEKANNGPALNSFQGANSYSLDDLKDNIQRCLEPLPIERANVSLVAGMNVEEKLSRDQKGKPVTGIVDEGESLIKKALDA